MTIIEICLNLRVCEVKALQWREVFMDDLIIYVTHMVDHEGHYREYIGHKNTRKLNVYGFFFAQLVAESNR